jgi:hypothetical protein
MYEGNESLVPQTLQNWFSEATVYCDENMSDVRTWAEE